MPDVNEGAGIHHGSAVAALAGFAAFDADILDDSSLVIGYLDGYDFAVVN